MSYEVSNKCIFLFNYLNNIYSSKKTNEMDSQHLLFGILLGGLLGFSGQVIRVVVGMKKMYDKARETTKQEPTPTDNLTTLVQGNIETKRLTISLIIGFVAGVLASITFKIAGSTSISQETVSGLLAAGYAGTDFIEGFMRKADPTPVFDRQVTQ
jgi:putative chitinase